MQESGTCIHHSISIKTDSEVDSNQADRYNEEHHQQNVGYSVALYHVGNTVAIRRASTVWNRVQTEIDGQHRLEIKADIEEPGRAC